MKHTLFRHVKIDSGILTLHALGEGKCVEMPLSEITAAKFASADHVVIWTAHGKHILDVTNFDVKEVSMLQKQIEEAIRLNRQPDNTRAEDTVTETPEPQG